MQSDAFSLNTLTAILSSFLGTVFHLAMAFCSAFTLSVSALSPSSHSWIRVSVDGEPYSSPASAAFQQCEIGLIPAAPVVCRSHKLCARWILFFRGAPFAAYFRATAA